MREEYLDEIEGDCQVELGNRENPFAEYCLELTAEVRRLKSDLESWQHIAHDRLKNWCMFTEKSGELEKENQRLKEEAKAIEGMKGYEDYLVLQRSLWESQQENRRYKQTLEEIVNQHDKPHSDRWTLAHIAQKALKGEGE
jgi:hypothetical protein